MKRNASKYLLLLSLLASLAFATSAHAGHRDSVGFTYVDRDSGFAIHLGGGDRYYSDNRYERRHYRRDRHRSHRYDRHHRHNRYCRNDRVHVRYYRDQHRRYDRHHRSHRYDRHDRRDRRHRRHH